MASDCNDTAVVLQRCMLQLCPCVLIITRTATTPASTRTLSAAHAPAHCAAQVACTGGGSNFGGIGFPLLREKLAGRLPDLKITAVEPAACPSLTKGKYTCAGPGCCCSAAPRLQSACCACAAVRTCVPIQVPSSAWA